MRIKNSLLIASLLFMLGCRNELSPLNRPIDGRDSMEILKGNSASASTSNPTESIVISCGSGCAISYSPKAIDRQIESIKVVFEANMYQDEVLTDNYEETYLFYYTASRKLNKIAKEGDKDDFLQTLMPESQRAFIVFGENLVKKSGPVNSNIQVNQFIAARKPKLITLPFSLHQYLSDDFSETKYPSNEPTNYLIDFLKKQDYDAEAYKSFVIRFDDDFLYLIVSITRGDSEYYVLITTKNDSVVDFKEIGEIGSENPTTFKVLPNYSVEKYKREESDLSLLEKFKINESGRIIKQ